MAADDWLGLWVVFVALGLAVCCGVAYYILLRHEAQSRKRGLDLPLDELIVTSSPPSLTPSLTRLTPLSEAVLPNASSLDFTLEHLPTALGRGRGEAAAAAVPPPRRRSSCDAAARSLVSMCAVAPHRAASDSPPALVLASSPSASPVAPTRRARLDRSAATPLTAPLRCSEASDDEASRSAGVIDFRLSRTARPKPGPSPSMTLLPMRSSTFLTTTVDKVDKVLSL
eukprot:TRINITY_DN27805_c0_g1_i1.p1 TRINITY_DN27805_c0_g1~~TRINITY_DN27805_c0_g1_i1.p1  ORF type:complete len:227 (+),score=21.08 TRINITY_DN27805_c0_g1_i1:41-721(+)